MNKKAISDILTKMAGFKKKGLFYLGNCNDSVISGYSVDAPPGAIFIWRFVLPSYDNLEFLHLSLGKRISTISHIQEEIGGAFRLREFLERDWSEFSGVKDCHRLQDYLKVEKFEGTYALWVRYLTYIRCGEFDAAERLDSDACVAEKFSDLAAVSQSFDALSETRVRRGWEGCSALLDEWCYRTRTAYC